MIKESPIIWGVSGGLQAGAVLLLAYLSLPLLATVVIGGLMTATALTLLVLLVLPALYHYLSLTVETSQEE